MLADVPLDAEAMTEEPFNPIAACVSVPDLDAALKVANSVHVGLAGYAFTNSLADAERIQRELEVGVLRSTTSARPTPTRPSVASRTAASAVRAGRPRSTFT